MPGYRSWGFGKLSRIGGGGVRAQVAGPGLFGRGEPENPFA